MSTVHVTLYSEEIGHDHVCVHSEELNLLAQKISLILAILCEVW